MALFVKGQARPPGSGKKKGQPNHATIEKIEAYQKEQRDIIERARISQLMPLDMMLSNMRWAAEKLNSLVVEIESIRTAAPSSSAQPLADRIVAIEARCERILNFGQRCARDAAPFLHPQLAAIKHEHRGADGELLRPVIEITGYPTNEPVALPAPRAPIASDNQTSH